MPRYTCDCHVDNITWSLKNVRVLHETWIFRRLLLCCALQFSKDVEYQCTKLSTVYPIDFGIEPNRQKWCSSALPLESPSHETNLSLFVPLPILQNYIISKALVRFVYFWWVLRFMLVFASRYDNNKASTLLCGTSDTSFYRYRCWRSNVPLHLIWKASNLSSFEF